MDLSQYGPDWYPLKPAAENSAQNHSAGSTAELQTAVQEAVSGDTILLTANRYVLNSALKIDKKLTIRSADPDKKSAIQYNGPAQTPAFEMNPKGELTLISIVLEGNRENYAFAPLKENMSSLYNLDIRNSEIANFDYLLKGYKHSFSEYIKIKSTILKNCANGLELSGEDDDRGEYNAENIFIADSRFENIGKNVIDYYRGGYDESTVGGNLAVTQQHFHKMRSKRGKRNSTQYLWHHQCCSFRQQIY